jgi:hypothetical protein
VIHACKFEADPPEDAEAFKNPSNMGVYRKGRTVKRAHHHARSALRPDLGQAA